MKKYKDPIELLKDGDINCKVVSAGLRHVKQTEMKTGGKSDYWMLSNSRHEKLSKDAKNFMNPMQINGLTTRTTSRNRIRG